MNEKKLLWQRKNRETFKKIKGYSTSAFYSTGQNRQEVLIRDGFKCVKCLMGDAEHRIKFKRPITIDHKDRDRKNNSLPNLQTLCLPCHGRKDISAHLKEKKFLASYRAAVEMRSKGRTYQQIADLLNFSVATVWKYLTGRVQL